MPPKARGDECACGKMVPNAEPMGGDKFADLDGVIAGIIDERRRFLQDQSARLEAAEKLSRQLQEATISEDFQVIRKRAASVLQGLPEAFQSLTDFADQASSFAAAFHEADVERLNLEQLIKKRATALEVTLDASGTSLRARRQEAVAEVEATERRLEFWEWFCAQLPLVGGTLFGWLSDRLRVRKEKGQARVDALLEFHDHHAAWLQAKSRCSDLKRELAQLKVDKEETTASIPSAAKQHVAFNVTEQTEALRRRLNSFPPFFDADWVPERWQGWQHDVIALSPNLVVGSLTEPPNELLSDGDRLVLPLLAPLIGSGNHWLIPSNPESEDASRRLFLALILRTALMLPHHCRHLLLDPKGQGQACPFAKLFPSIELQTLKLHECLEMRVTEISRIIQDYLDDRVCSFEQLPDPVRMNERFEFIFAASFPTDYDSHSIKQLQRISKNGPVAGKYLVIEHQADVPLPPGVSMDGFVNLRVIDPSRLPMPPVDVSPHSPYRTLRLLA